jgi:carboxymethylenebutenolidase
MWNAYRTDDPANMHCSIVDMPAGGGDVINAYVARPTGGGPYPGVVLIHHAPGWDEWYREFARRFAANGFIAIAPNYYFRYGHGTPDDVTAKVRADGGISDDSVVADSVAAMQWIKSQPDSNGKVGITGTCSGGRHTVVVVSRAQGFDAAADLWGGRVVQAPEQLTAKQPVAPIDMTKDLSAPLLGLFGNDDQGPSPAQVDQHEAALKEAGKVYSFHRYDGAAHGFMYYHSPNYRPQAAMDGWNKLAAWFNQYLRA